MAANATGYPLAHVVLRRIDLIVRRSGLPALGRREALRAHRYPTTPKAARSLLGSRDTAGASTRPPMQGSIRAALPSENYDGTGSSMSRL